MAGPPRPAVAPAAPIKSAQRFPWSAVAIFVGVGLFVYFAWLWLAEAKPVGAAMLVAPFLLLITIPICIRANRTTPGFDLGGLLLLGLLMRFGFAYYRFTHAFDAYVSTCDDGVPWVKEVTYDTPFGDGYMLGTFSHRTAKLGDAWYPIGTNPKNRLDTLARLQAGLERLHKMAREAGRDPKEVGLAYRFSQFGAIPERADNGDRRLGSGDNAAIVGDLRALRDLGVLAVDFSFAGDTADATLANMRRFREDVLAKV